MTSPSQGSSTPPPTFPPGSSYVIVCYLDQASNRGAKLKLVMAQLTRGPIMKNTGPKIEDYKGLQSCTLFMGTIHF